MFYEMLKLGWFDVVVLGLFVYRMRLLSVMCWGD